MTQSPNPNPDNESNPNPTRPPRRRRRRWLWLGFILLAGIGGGVTAGWFILKQQLTPQLTRILSESVDRPVNLGEVDSLSLTSVRFGKTEVPKTATDPDWAIVKAVDVQFNPLRVLTERTLELHVTLIEPTAYIEEDENGQWLAIAPQEDAEESPLTIDVQTIEAKDGKLAAVKRKLDGTLNDPVELVAPTAVVRMFEDYELIEAKADGSFVGGGKFSLSGSTRWKEIEAKIALTAQEVNLPYLSRMVAAPFSVEEGTAGVNLDIELNGDPREEFPTARGVVTLQNLSAKVDEKALGIDATRKGQQPEDVGERSPFYFLNDLPITLPPVTETEGRFRFQGTGVRVENFSTQLGEIAATAGGTIDLESGFNLAVQTEPVALKTALDTFGLEPPGVPLSGAFSVALRATGPLEKPLILGSLKNANRVRVDKVAFRDVRAKFAFSVASLALTLQEFRALPLAGGQVLGKGLAKFGKEGERGSLLLNLQTRNVPGDAIAALYVKDLPLTIGPVSSQVQIFGPLDKIENLQAKVSSNLLQGGTISARNLRIKDKRWQGTVQASNLQLAKFLPLPPELRRELGTANAVLNLGGRLDSVALNTFSAQGFAKVNVAGGTITANNLRLNNGRISSQILASGVEVGRVASQFVPPNIPTDEIGPLNGSFDVAGTLGGNTTGLPLQDLTGMGSFRIAAAGGTITANNLRLNNSRISSQILASGVEVGRVASQFVPPNIPTAAIGPLNGSFDVAGTLGGNTAGLPLQAIAGTGSFRVAAAGGTITANRFQLAGDRVTADVTASGVQLTRFTARLPLPKPLAEAQMALGSLSGTASLSGRLSSLDDPKTLTARGKGRVNVAGGTANTTFQLNNGNWQANIVAAGIRPQRLSSKIPAQFNSPVSGNLNLSGTLDNLTPEAILAQGSGRLNLAGGSVTASNFRLANGNLQAVIVPQGIQLAQFSDLLEGSLGGSINVAANIANLTPQSIRADGRVNFSQGLSLIDRPLTAAFNWNGSRLAIERATATGLSASGYVDVNVASLTRGQIGPDLVRQFNLDVDARGLNLAKLSEEAKALLPLEPQVARVVNEMDVRGLADFNGNLRGTLTAPQAVGTLALRNFALNDLALDPVMSGPVALTPGQGASVRLTGANDKVEVELGPNYKPNSFLLQVDEFVARGTRSGDLLAVNASQLPLAWAKQVAPTQLLPPEIASQPLSGRLSGQFNVNLNTFATSGTIEIDKPLIARISGEKFTGSFQYANGAGAITNARFQQGETEYLLDGRVVMTATGPEFDGELTLDRGQIQDILASLQLFDLRDFTTLLSLPSYGNAADLNATAISVANKPLLTQLRRLSEIEALLEEHRRQRAAASPLPPLDEAIGFVSGKVDVSGNLQDGLQAKFDFDAEELAWGPFTATEAIVQGNFENGVLTVRPFKLELEEGGAIAFSGSVGGEMQSGQLKIVNFPILLLQEFVALPPDIGFTGFINATASLGGRKENPQARGQMTVVGAELNDEEIESAQGSFNYKNALLNFSLTSVIEAGTEPLLVSGYFPYQIPLEGTSPPESDELKLTLKLKDNGLTVLNVLTRQQLQWEEGTGEVDVTILGRYDQKENKFPELRATGNIDIADAQVASLFLPDPLTDLNGNIAFNFDSITVNDLQGKFGGGNILVAGTLPLIDPTPTENPLTIALEELAVSLKGLYSGGVRGQIQMTGAALQPGVGGQVELFDGRVLLSGLAAGGQGNLGGGSSSSGGATGQIVALTDLKNLELKLGNNLQLEQPFLIKFGTEGSIFLNGRVSDPKPSGTVRLVSGGVNLFATQLRLSRDYENVAIFRPEFGLNPKLDLRLAGNVVETTRTPTTTEPFSNEISDSTINFGSVETLRVEAIVNGFALDLIESLKVQPGIESAQRVRSVLKLTSSPPRSETQIIGLLGGSFINAFAGDGGTLGLANLAGNALFGSVQQALGDALGLTEFRIFPSVVPDDDDRSATFGLAAELGYDITNSLGVSVTQFLTPQVPTQVNVRYRLNDYVLLRGSTNFSGENRAVIEYRQRF